MRAFVACGLRCVCHQWSTRCTNAVDGLQAIIALLRIMVAFAIVVGVLEVCLKLTMVR